MKCCMAVPRNFQVAFNLPPFFFVFVGRKRLIILTDDGLDGLVIRVLLGTARTAQWSPRKEVK